MFASNLLISLDGPIPVVVDSNNNSSGSNNTSRSCCCCCSSSSSSSAISIFNIYKKATCSCNLISLKNFFNKNNNCFSFTKKNIKFNYYTFSKILLSSSGGSSSFLYFNRFVNVIILMSLNLWLIRHKITYYKEGFSI